MPDSAPETISDLLTKAQHLLRVKADNALRDMELTVPQYAALAALAVESGLSAAALARRCHVTPQTMTGIVAQLIKAGLIAREPHPEHGRILQTALTAKGRDVLRRAERTVREIEEKMLAELDRAEREAFADLLAQCARALEF